MIRLRMLLTNMKLPQISKLALSVMTGVVVFGCSAGVLDTSANEPTEANIGPGGRNQQTSINSVRMNRDIVRSGSLTIEVEALEKAERAANHVTRELGGRVDHLKSSDLAGPDASIAMTIRIPISQFESALEAFEKLGDRTGKEVMAQDVTSQLADFGARTKTMLAQEEVLRNMLRRAKNLDDSITLNSEITRVRGEIESQVAQRKVLADQAAYSTIELTLKQQPSAIAASSKNANWFQNSWAAAWSAGIEVFQKAVSLGMWLLVFSPIWLLLAVGIRWGIKASAAARSS